MLKNRILLAVITGSAFVVPLAGITVLTSSPAGATAPSGISCSKATGTVSTITDSATIDLKDCTGTTGGSGTTQGTEGQTKGTVTWKNKDTTSSTVNETNGTKCPSGGLADELIKGKVTTDTTGSTAKGAKLRGEICVSSKLKVSLAPGTTWTYAA